MIYAIAMEMGGSAPHSSRDALIGQRYWCPVVDKEIFYLHVLFYFIFCATRNGTQDIAYVKQVLSLSYTPSSICLYSCRLLCA